MPKRIRQRSQQGMVTAEAAVVLPLIALFTMALIWMVVVVIAQVQLVDAARDGARAVARGEDRGVAVEHALRTAPEGTQVAVSSRSDIVTVEVEVEARAPSWLIIPLPSIQLDARASVAREDDLE